MVPSKTFRLISIKYGPHHKNSLTTNEERWFSEYERDNDVTGNFPDKQIREETKRFDKRDRGVFKEK